jgi:hypothetical protein
MTTPATARARQYDYADHDDTHLRSKRLGLWLEHCRPELAAVFAAWCVFWVFWTGYAATELGAYAAVTATVGPLTWWLTGPRSVERRRARRIEDRWAKACAKHGLVSVTRRYGCTYRSYPDLTNIRYDRGNITADGRLPEHMPFSALAASRPLLEASYARGAQRSLELHGDDHRREFRLTITRWVAFDRHTTDPWPYQPRQGVAVREDGQPVHFEVGPEGPAVLVAGIKGSGKSSWVNAIVAEAVSDPGPVELVGIDLKRTELAPWRNQFARLALDPHDVTDVLRYVFEENHQRTRWMEQHGVRKWHPGLPFPRLLLVIDELRQLATKWPGDEDGEPGERIALAASIGALGRAQAVQLVCATQNPRAAYVGEIRENCDITICCRVRTENEAFTALGDIGRQLRPDQITKAEQGVAWVVGDDRPYKARARWLDDHAVATIAGRVQGIDWDPATPGVQSTPPWER